MKMRTLNTHLLEDKMDEAMTHYINTHPQHDSVQVDTNALALNVQEDPGGRVLTVMHQQNFPQQICRQVPVSEVGDGSWGEELIDPELRLAAIVAQLSQNARHHQPQASHLKVTSVRSEVDTSVILDAPLRLYNGHSLEQQAESLVVQCIQPLPPLQDMKRGQEPDWFNSKTKVVLKEETCAEAARGGSPGGGRSVCRRSLPHKKRISRRLRRQPPILTPTSTGTDSHQDIVVINCEGGVAQEEILPDNYVTVAQDHITGDTHHHIAHEVRPVLICQLCDEFYGEDQLKFYHHLKQHYESHATIIIENPVSDLGIDKMTNTCIVDNSAALPDSLVELSLEDTLPKTTIYQSQMIDKNVLYSESDKALTAYANKAHYSVAAMDKEPCAGEAAEKMGELEGYHKPLLCPRCPRNFRRQRQLDDHVKEAHNKMAEEMCEFSEPEDLMEGITVSVEDQLDLPTLTVDNGHVHQDHIRHWYMRGGGVGVSCGGDGLCPVCPAAAPNAARTTHDTAHLKEEVLNRILDAEADAGRLSNSILEELPEQTRTQPQNGTELPQQVHMKQEPDNAPQPAQAQPAEEPQQPGPKGRKKKVLKCGECGRVFHHRNSLVYHALSHSDTRPHICDTCNKGFYTANALKIHKRKHNDEKPERCDKCGRMFRQWSDLKYHITSIHSNLKAHKCEFCGKEFARKYSLIVHRRIHTGEKNYKCELCTKTFRTSSYRIAHMKTHTGEKPYKCETCSKGFRDMGDLRRHMTIHNKVPGAKKREPKAKGKKQTANLKIESQPQTIDQKVKIEDDKLLLQIDIKKTEQNMLAANKTARKQTKKIKKTIELPKHEAFKTSELSNVEVLDTRQYNKYKEVYNDQNIVVTEVYPPNNNDKLKNEREFATLKPIFKTFEVDKTMFQTRNENTDGKMQVYTHVENKKDFNDINDIPLRTNIDMNARSDMQGEAIDNTFMERLNALYSIQSV